MTWFFLALMAAITSAVFSLVQRRFSRDQAHFDDIVTAQSFQFGCALLFFCTAFVMGLPLLPKIPSGNLLLLAISYGLGSLTMFASLKRLPANVAVILQSTSVMWTALFATLFLQQHFSLLTGIALLCIVSAVLFVSYTPQRRHVTENISGTVYGLLSGLLFGIGMVNDAAILNQQDLSVPSFLGVGFAVPGIFLLIVGAHKTPRLIKAMRQRLFVKNLVLTSIAYSASALFFYLAVKRMDITPVSIVNQSQVALTALGGIILLHERERILQHIIGVCLAMSGLVLINLA